MSATLKWRPYALLGHTLPEELKFAIRGRIHGYSKFDEGDLEYIAGLVDARVKGADKLVDLIRKHGVIELWLEH